MKNILYIDRNPLFYGKLKKTVELHLTCFSPLLKQQKTGLKTTAKAKSSGFPAAKNNLHKQTRKKSGMTTAGF